MIDDLVAGCFETFGHWILGIVFFVAAVAVLLAAPSGENMPFRWFLAFLLFHTSAMLIVGFGFDKAKRPLAISWAIVLVVFIGAAVLLA